MDFHILIVITCVFLASLFSLLFINKFFRRKTFEEIIAEKRALTEKIYGQGRLAKKPRKLQQMKKEFKREKKLKLKDPQKDPETEESDIHSEIQSLEDSSPQVQRKQKNSSQGVFSKAEMVSDYDSIKIKSTNGENSNQQPPQQAPLKGGNNKSNKKRGSENGGKFSNVGSKNGILINKNELVTLDKENGAVDEVGEINQFETKRPKDAFDVKKIEKQQQQQQSKKVIKKNASSAFISNTSDSNIASVGTATIVASTNPSTNANEVHTITKEIKQQDEKGIRQGSPKNQSKLKQHKKKSEKELVGIEKLCETDIIGVSLLMNLFNRADLNRSEIQILIDYLLNKQQDMPSTHSEWSDDIVQKLKRQLEEKEKKLQEEQEASLGIQAKLRDLRQEINNERLQMNATMRAYIEDVQAKKQEIIALNQEIQTINDKIALERQQFQTKLRMEKQTGSQDLLIQLQRENDRSNILQNELVHKDKCLTELTCIVNASHQAVEESKQKSNEIIQTQVNQICALEQKLDEAEVLINEQRYTLEQYKKTENDVDASKVEVRNLQNALDSTKSELVSARNELELSKSDLDFARSEANEKQKQFEIESSNNNELSQKIEVSFTKNNDLLQTINILTEKNNELSNQIETVSAKNNDLSHQIEDYKLKCEEITNDHYEVQVSLDQLRALMLEKDERIFDYEESNKKLALKEKELLQQLHEQKEKNNELRKKNWKLVDALKTGEIAENIKVSNARVVLQQQYASDTGAPTLGIGSADEKYIRDLFERLYPEAVKVNSASVFSLSLDQWVEQVVVTHCAQSATRKGCNNKPTETNSSSYSNHYFAPYNHVDLQNSEDLSGSNNNSKNIANVSNLSKSVDQSEIQKLRAQNAQLRGNIDELTKLVKKTSITLTELESRAREQDEHWRSIVQSKEEEISLLKHSNGEQKCILEKQSTL